MQSAIASEHPGVFDCLREGLSRALHWQMTRTTRLLPIWLLCGPTLTYRLAHYVIFSTVRVISLQIYGETKTPINEKEDSNGNVQFVEIICSFWGNLIADTLLFPLETITNRYGLLQLANYS